WVLDKVFGRPALKGRNTSAQAAEAELQGLGKEASFKQKPLKGDIRFGVRPIIQHVHLTMKG
ncbi:MAG: hypothetical protein WEB30_17190, partial [Cyclobacteriaceae bacterium]